MALSSTCLLLILGRLLIVVMLTLDQVFEFRLGRCYGSIELVGESLPQHAAEFSQRIASVSETEVTYKLGSYNQQNLRSEVRALPDSSFCNNGAPI
jgi:hypothetical protein